MISIPNALSIYRKEALAAYEARFRSPGREELMSLPRWVNRAFWTVLALAVCLVLAGILGQVPISVSGPATLTDLAGGQVLVRVELPRRYRDQVRIGTPMQLFLPLDGTTYSLVVEAVEPSPLGNSSAVFYATASLPGHGRPLGAAVTTGTAVVQVDSQRLLFLLRRNAAEGAG